MDTKIQKYKYTDRWRAGSRRRLPAPPPRSELEEIENNWRYCTTNGWDHVLSISRKYTNTNTRLQMHKQHYSTWKRSSTIGGIAQRSDHRAHGSHLVALGLLGAHRWLISNSIKQIHEHRNTNTETKYIGSTWVTLGLWQKPAGGRQVAAAVCCRLFCHQQPLRHPPNLPYAIGPLGPKMQKILNMWSKKIRPGPKYQKVCPKYSCSLLATSSTTRPRHPPHQPPAFLK